MSAAESGNALYVDTGALGRVLLDEPDADLIAAELSRYGELMASHLMRVELRRVAVREGRAEQLDRLASIIGFIPLTESILLAAETVRPASVPTLGAIHLVTALEAQRAGVLASIMTFDRRLGQAAASHGLTVVAPAA